MKITRIKFSGFKNSSKKAKEFILGDVTKITGENYAGKTTIAEAITWGLYGCNLQGNDKADSVLLNKDSKSMTVEIDFIDNQGIQHILVREKKGNKTSVVLDDGPVKQSDLASILPEKNIFLAVFNVEYFNSLGSTKARELLTSVFPKIEKQQVFEKLCGSEVEILKNMNLSDTNFTLSNLRKEISDAEKDIEYFEGQKDLLEAQIEESDTHGEKVEFDDIELKQLEREYEQLLHEITEYKQYPVEEQPQLKSVSELLQAINEKFNEANQISTQILKLQNEIEKLQDKYKSTRSSKKKVNLKAGDICSTCGQAITEEHIQKCEQEAKWHNEMIDEELESIANEGKEKAAERDQLKEKHEAILQEIKELETQKSTIDSDNEKILQLHEDAIKKKRRLIDEENNRIQEESNKKCTALKNKIDTLKAQQFEVLQHNREIEEKQKQLDKLKKDFEASIQKLEAQKQRLVELEAKKAAVTRFVIEKSELQLEPIQKNLDKVSVELEKIIKSTGEVKPAFEIFYEGREFNVLSYSERLRVGIEIGNLINEITGLKIPVFIDNAESITHYKKPNTQIFEAYVVKDQLLKVEVE